MTDSQTEFRLQDSADRERAEEYGADLSRQRYHQWLRDGGIVQMAKDENDDNDSRYFA